MLESVLRYIRDRKLIAAGDRVLVAVSGGADSVALLRLLLELRADLGIVLAVAHFNHRLRGDDSDADEHFVVDLAQRHGLDVWVERGQVAERAGAERVGLEATGRKLRYGWLAKTAGERRFDCVATAHTLDDQAETVLMKFLRGAASKGLAGIYPEVRRDENRGIRFTRPLLSSTRAEVETYLVSIDQSWREDESNLDRRFRRNRVRHELLPLLEQEYNPNIRQTLSDLSEISRVEEEYWSELASMHLDRLRDARQRLRLDEFGTIPPALQRRMLKQWLEEHGIATDFQHIELLRGSALGDSNEAELSQGWHACVTSGYLVLKRWDPEPLVGRYLYPLHAPGEVAIHEIGCIVRVVPVPAEPAAESEPGTLLSAGLLNGELKVRNWESGDRYRPAYSGSEQKLKRLFAERKIPVEERILWPVVLKGEDIVAVRGLPVADRYCWRPGTDEALSLEWILVVKV